MLKQMFAWARMLATVMALALCVGALACCAPSTPDEKPSDEDDTPQDGGEQNGAPDENIPDPPAPPFDEDWDAYITAAPKMATEILLLGAADGANGLLQATLQGLAAKNSTTQILLRNNAWSKYIKYIEDRGVKISTKNQAGASWSLKTLLEYYAPTLDGYILCSSDLTSESASVAVSLSHQLNAVVATSEQIKMVEDAGLTMVLDVTDKDDAWLRQSEYFANLSTTVAVEQPVTMAPKLIDYAVMSGAYCYFYNGNDGKKHTEKFEFLDDGAVVIGWNNTLGEYDTVKSFSQLNACLIPADHAYNLSTLSSFAGSGKLNEELYADATDTPNIQNEAVHTVCFVLSDGDNLQWALNDYTSDRWYGYEWRGTFPMTWGLPPLLGDLALPMLEYFADTQTDEDEFIMQLSGLGYTFPSLWTEEARLDMADTLAQVMETRGLKYMSILDDHGFTKENLEAFTSSGAVEGIFYTDYSNYAGYKGEILWVNDVPVVSARYRLWAGLNDGSIENIANSINAAAADVTGKDAYSFVIVHAWSGLSSDGNFTANNNTMRAVEELISRFDDNVEVVGASEFFNRIKYNLAP